MLNIIKKILSKNPEIFSYFIIGVFTTIVSWGTAFSINIIFFHNQLHPSLLTNIILVAVNWSSGVIFSFFTLRKFVFEHTNNIFSEARRFVFSRLFTLLLHLIITEVSRQIGINYYIYTFISAVIVVIVNYILSKFFVYKNIHI